MNKTYIISDDCWSTGIYSSINKRYETPFVNLFIFAPCYIKLLKKLDKYLNTKLIITDLKNTKYRLNFNYVLGLLGDVEIHFSHIKKNTIDNKTIIDMWERRVGRLPNNKDEIIFKFGDLYPHRVQKHYIYFENFLKEFHELPYKYKISFTNKKYDYKNNFLIKEKHNGNAKKLGENLEEYIKDLI